MADRIFGQSYITIIFLQILFCVVHRGLVMTKILYGLEQQAGRPVTELFDWIAGTSTGGILTLALALGKSTRECQALYFR